MIRLQITGMSCAHCVTAVEAALTSVDGVVSASVDPKSEIATVEGDANVEALVAAVQEEGYQAAPAGPS